MNIEDINPVHKLHKKCHKHDCSDIIVPTITDEEIIDISKTSRSNYYCVFSRFPNLIYYIQSFALPSSSNRKIQIDRPNEADYVIAGHKTDYEEMTLNFYMDENFYTYFSLLNWIRENETRPYIRDTIAQLSLVILNNAKTPIIRIDFSDVLCTSLGDIQFENQSPDTIVYYASFSSYKYKITYLNGSKLVIL